MTNLKTNKEIYEEYQSVIWNLQGEISELEDKKYRIETEISRKEREVKEFQETAALYTPKERVEKAKEHNLTLEEIALMNTKQVRRLPY